MVKSSKNEEKIRKCQRYNEYDNLLEGGEEITEECQGFERENSEKVVKND